MRRALVPAALLCLMLFAAEASAKTGAEVKLVDSRFGKIIVDGEGFTLYAFNRDEEDESTCYGRCAAAWPPLYTKGKPDAIGRARDSKLGVTRRKDGRRQVTYGGYPLYYYVNETEPGEIFCQNVFLNGGLWLLVNRAGNLIR
jgi:predicted lipoprotein with Yx(FWY)xxD motif